MTVLPPVFRAGQPIVAADAPPASVCRPQNRRAAESMSRHHHDHR